MDRMKQNRPRWRSRMRGLVAVACVAAIPAQAIAEGATCALSRDFSQMPHPQGLRTLAHDPERLFHIIEAYQCLGMFKLVAEHGLTPDAKDIGTQLVQTGTTFLLIDSDMNSSGLVAAAPGLTLDIPEFLEPRLRNFWMRYHAVQLADQMIHKTADDDAEGMVFTIANCLTIASAIQKHQSDPGLQADLQRIAAPQPEGTLADPQLSRDKAAFHVNFLFGYTRPTGAEVSENLDLAAKLAPAVKMGFMGWEQAGRPQPEIFTPAFYEQARSAIQKMCP